MTISALQGIKTMASARIGWIGGISPGFYNMQFEEANLRARFGTTIGHHTIAEIVERARAVDDREAVSVVGHATRIATEVTAPSLGWTVTPGSTSPSGNSSNRRGTTRWPCSAGQVSRTTSMWPHVWPTACSDPRTGWPSRAKGTCPGRFRCCS